MKKLLFFVLSLTFVLAGCSNDDDNGNQTTYLQVKATFDSGNKVPNGYVSVFYLDNVDVTDYTPYYSDPRLVTLKDTNNEKISPVYWDELAYFDGQKYTVKSIYFNKLSPMYGIPKKDGKFLVMLVIHRPSTENFGYSYTYKEVSFTNIELNKTFRFNVNHNDLTEFGNYYDKW